MLVGLTEQHNTETNGYSHRETNCNGFGYSMVLYTY